MPNHGEDTRRLADLRRRLLSLIVHELRTPLDQAAGFLDLVGEHSLRLLPETEAACIHRSKEAMARLSARMDEIGLFASLDAGVLELRKKRCTLRDLLESAVAEAEREALEHGVPVGIECPRELAVSGDAEVLEKALRGLVALALQRALLSRDVRKPKVTLRAAEAADGVEVRVADSGPEISGLEARALLEGFSGLRNLEHHGSARHGLGLAVAVAHGVARLHQGDFTIAAGDAPGVEFRLLLPASDGRAD